MIELQFIRSNFEIFLVDVSFYDKPYWYSRLELSTGRSRRRMGSNIRGNALEQAGSALRQEYLLHGLSTKRWR